MPSPFVQNTAYGQPDISPRSSFSAPLVANGHGGQHLRRRSSQVHLASPLTQQMTYDEKTGEIRLPTNSRQTWSPSLKASSEKHTMPAWAASRGSFGSWMGPRRRAGAPFLPKPWIAVITLSTLTFALLFLMSRMMPVRHHISSKAIMSKLPFTGTRNTCDPYTAFGTLEVDDSDADRNRWVPFDPTCQPPALMAALRNDKPKLDFSWLHGKTALLIGDLVSREHVENFCSLLGEESEIIRPSHKYSPQSMRQRTTSRNGEASRQPSRQDKRAIDRSHLKNARDASSPRMCYIRKHDFLIVSVLHYGFDQEDYWRDADLPQYTAPGMFEHRLTDIIEPLIQNIRADGRASAPDLVEVTSGAWDLARWAEQDLENQKATDVPLAEDRVTWWRFRAGQALDKVHKSFPKARGYLWRTTHYPKDQVAEYDYFQDKISRREPNATMTHDPPYFAHNRINQLDQAARSLILPKHTTEGLIEAPHPEFRINEWGQLLKGHNAHQRDRLHGDPLPGGYVWSDIMLYELRRAVTAVRDRRPLRKLGH